MLQKYKVKDPSFASIVDSHVRMDIMQEKLEAAGFVRGALIVALDEEGRETIALIATWYRDHSPEPDRGIVFVYQDGDRTPEYRVSLADPTDVYPTIVGLLDPAPPIVKG